MTPPRATDLKIMPDGAYCGSVNFSLLNVRGG